MESVFKDFVFILIRTNEYWHIKKNGPHHMACSHLCCDWLEDMSANQKENIFYCLWAFLMYVSLEPECTQNRQILTVRSSSLQDERCFSEWAACNNYEDQSLDSQNLHWNTQYMWWPFCNSSIQELDIPGKVVKDEGTRQSPLNNESDTCWNWT